MSESLRKKLVFAALILSIAWAWYNFDRDSDNDRSDRAETIQPVAREDAPTAAVAEEEVSRMQAADWGRDPFGAVPYARQAPGPSWNLRGIIYSPSSPMAYINGRRVEVGDEINRATVIAISKQAVTLEYQGRRFDITVRKG